VWAEVCVCVVVCVCGVCVQCVKCPSVAQTGKGNARAVQIRQVRFQMPCGSGGASEEQGCGAAVVWRGGRRGESMYASNVASAQLGAAVLCGNMYCAR